MKATALLKLIYLEMFGHDMSWASFHVLEVMSSPKYLQKRVGYLGAVQSFRPDTEVLMLATNLLKKVEYPLDYIGRAALTSFLGYHVAIATNYVVTTGHNSPHYHALPSTISPFRLVAAYITLASQHTEKNNRCTLSACSGVS